MKEDDLNGIIEALKELQDDKTIPKNVRNRLLRIESILKEGTEASIKVNKALDELEEIQSDSNLQSFTRTQIWNIASLLESI